MASLQETGVLERADLGILDHGLRPWQAEQISKAATVVRPKWTMNVPDEFLTDRYLGLIARPELRTYFPGYDIYLWFDADAWAQTGEFLDCYIDGALTHGLAVAREDGIGYRRSWVDRRWWAGNYMLGFGGFAGLRAAFAPTVNIGLIALAADAPHWDVWKDFYKNP